MSPAVQEAQEAPTVLLGRGALDRLYLLWGRACPGLGIQGSPSLLSLQEGLMTLVVPVFRGGPSLQGDLLQELPELPWDLAIQEVPGHLGFPEGRGTRSLRALQECLVPRCFPSPRVCQECLEDLAIL